MANRAQAARGLDAQHALLEQQRRARPCPQPPTWPARSGSRLQRGCTPGAAQPAPPDGDQRDRQHREAGHGGVRGCDRRGKSSPRQRHVAADRAGDVLPRQRDARRRAALASRTRPGDSRRRVSQSDRGPAREQLRHRMRRRRRRRHVLSVWLPGEMVQSQQDERQGAQDPRRRSSPPAAPHALPPVRTPPGAPSGPRPPVGDGASGGSVHCAGGAGPGATHQHGGAVHDSSTRLDGQRDPTVVSHGVTGRIPTITKAGARGHADQAALCRLPWARLPVVVVTAGRVDRAAKADRNSAA